MLGEVAINGFFGTVAILSRETASALPAQRLMRESHTQVHQIRRGSIKRASLAVRVCLFHMKSEEVSKRQKIIDSDIRPNQTGPLPRVGLAQALFNSVSLTLSFSFDKPPNI